MSQTVRDYYNQNAAREWDRLERPYRRLEFESTMRLVERYFPRTGSVADIGCGPGRYSIEMLKRGYRVTLVDLSEESLEIARGKMAELGLMPGGVFAGSACCLDFLEDSSYDAALFMGPMYHLVKPEDRVQALSELLRILKPGAVAIIAYINSWGVIRSLITESPEFYRDINQVYKLIGEYSQEGPQQGFTEAYFTIPPKARDELEKCGFSIVTYAGAEGYASGCLEQLIRMSVEDPAAYMNIIDSAADLCEQPQWRDSTEHIHFVVRKPETE